MCAPETEFQDYIYYPKHICPPNLETHEVVTRTGGGQPALYLPATNVEEIEKEAAADGTFVSSGKPATFYKVHAFDHDIGASNGALSRWIRVESTNGGFHGHPIPESRYIRMLTKAIVCIGDC